MKNLVKLLLFSFLLMPVCASCQNVQKSNMDTLFNDTGYDVENNRYMGKYIDNYGVEQTYYFTRNCDTISSFDWRINLTTINKIKDRILSEFDINEFTEAQGSAVLLLIFDFNSEVYEIRLIRGITQGFNNELLRVIKKIEKDLIFVSATDLKKAIVTPFAIRLNEKY